MRKSRSKFLKIVDEKHDINFHWPKHGRSPSRAYCILAKSTNSNFQFTLLFESPIGSFPKTLLLVRWAKIQYARDGERPDL